MVLGMVSKCCGFQNNILLLLNTIFRWSPEAPNSLECSVNVGDVGGEATSREGGRVGMPCSWKASEVVPCRGESAGWEVDAPSLLLPPQRGTAAPLKEEGLTVTLILTVLICPEKGIWMINRFFDNLFSQNLDDCRTANSILGEVSSYGRKLRRPSML